MRAQILAGLYVLLIAPMTIEAQEFNIWVPDNVQVVIVDSLGRCVGYDPATRQVRKEYPDCGYSLEGVGDSDVEPGQQTNDQEYNLWIDEHLVGVYTVRILGVSGSRYSLRITQGIKRRLIIQRESYIRPGTQQDFRLDITRENRGSLQRSPHPKSLSEDLQAVFEAGALGDKRFYDQLKKDATQYERQLSKGDSLKARKELEQFEQKIDQEYRRDSRNESTGRGNEKRFIKKDAYQLLKEDVTTLLEQLPEHRKGKGWERGKDERKDKKEKRD